jgi:hypothetical protein
MQIRACTALAVALAGVALAAPSFATSHDEVSKKAAAAVPQMSKEEQAAMDEMMKLGTPGEMHQVLVGMTGDWTAASKSWMAPGAPPMESMGTAVKKMLYGGRYLSEEYSGDMMGTPFQGMGISAFDNQKKKFVGTWMDSMSTAMLVWEGSYDAATKTMSMTSSMYDPMHRKVVPIRMRTRYVDPSTHVFEFWGLGPDGKEMKSMEITYKKKA